MTATLLQNATSSAPTTTGIKMRTKHIALSCLLACMAGSVLAADRIPAEVFARHAEYGGAMLLPTGEYLSVITPYKDRHGF